MRTEPPERSGVRREHGIGHQRHRRRANEKRRVADERDGDLSRPDAGRRWIVPRQRPLLRPSRSLAGAHPVDDFTGRSTGERVRVEEVLAVAVIGDGKSRHSELIYERRQQRDVVAFDARRRRAGLEGVE